MSINLSSSDLIGYVIELEQFEATTLEQKVIEKAMQASFVNNSDSVDNLYKLSWIKEMTQHAEDAFKLEAVVDGEDLKVTISNFNQLLERRDKQVSDILELLAKRVIDAAPLYKG
jgi:hypothetical protein